MLFITNIFPASPSPPARSRISCCAATPTNPSSNNHTSDNPLIDDSNGSHYLRSLNPQQHPDHLPNNIPQPSPQPTPTHSSSPHDVWDTLIDDHTPIHHIIHPPNHSPSSSQQPSTTQFAQARMAARPSSTPKPQFSQTNSHIPKRKRGRPKGSKSSHTSSTSPPPQVSPFMSAVREDLRRRTIASNRHLISGILDAQSEQTVNWDQLHLTAPNGLPDPDNSNKDLLQELLPILAQQENEEKRIISDDEKRVRELISTCYTQFSSIHRSSDRLDNLKPYKLKTDSEQGCHACNGTGMTVCPYCDGQGYVDLGENGEKFNPKFGNNEFSMPKHVMGNTYHCPLCGGIQKERCETCFGTGTAQRDEHVIEGAAKEPKDNRAWRVFDFDELMRREADRIEVGLDGVVIMRAKRRGSRKKTTAKDESEKSPVRGRRRGRPPKKFEKDLASTKKWDHATESPDGVEPDVDPTQDLQGQRSDTSVPLTDDGDQISITTPETVGIPRGRPVVRTTDFVNTTDYQVGRRLQRQSPTVGPGIQGSSDVTSSVSQENQDGAE